MPYNISNWATIELKDFKLTDTFEDDEDHIIWGRDNAATINLFNENNYIKGVIRDGWVEVSAMHLVGEGSGTIFTEFRADRFPNSTGTLRALLIWEDGEEVELIEIVDGDDRSRELDIVALLAENERLKAENADLRAGSG